MTCYKNIYYFKKKILVIENSEIIINLIRDTLVNEGLIVLDAKNGKQGLNILIKEKIDLIILQYEMTDIDAMTFYKNLHSMKELKSILIITMCDKKTDIPLKRIIQAGSSACLIKPFDMNYLIVLIENLLSNHFLLLLKEK
jgi:DNA-binding response OmpR family regulator